MITKLAAGALFSAMATLAQTAPPAAPPATQYDLVSTVKPSHSVDDHLRIRMDAGSIYIQDASLKDLLSNTYGKRDSLIVNLPRWASSEHFDIKAKVLSDDANFLQHLTQVQRRQIFERLLSERFGVISHIETRTSPIYELTKTGPGRQLIENPPPPPSSQREVIRAGHDGRGNTSVVSTHLDATGVRIADLCANLARILDRSVIDKTGLTSFYDITLDWSDDRAADSDAQSTGPSLFAALQEQLGLRLVPSKGLVEVLVVDKAIQPASTDN